MSTSSGVYSGSTSRPEIVERSSAGFSTFISPNTLPDRNVERRRRLSWRDVSEYVFSMYRVDKFYGPERQVLANISLSFFHGAKIGVLGPNGAGKSTLLRIMAGREEPSSGIAELHPSATVGLLEQEPELDPAKDVRGNVEDGVRELRVL